MANSISNAKAPNTPALELSNGAIAVLIIVLLLKGIAPAKQWHWRVEPTAFTKCPVHQVYMHVSGCAICND